MPAINEQVVLITGASRGLGAATARAFAREGARVIINYYQSAEKAEALADTLGADQALAVQADVRDPDAVHAMVTQATDHFGAPVHTVISNALINYQFDPAARDSAPTIDWAAYDEQLSGTVRGALNALQACLPGMKDAGFGRFVAIGSNLVQNPVVPYHDYTTAKAALLGWVRNMAHELGAAGITVNMVSGGLLKTTDASAATSDEVFGLIKESTPLQMVTAPEDVADAILFFASPWARAVTGQNLIVDGGLVMR
ncbi:3-oxoacyl-ACP reductase [Salisaeta longa]|uniref:3-oxoacyl-ACP reductase n=1 Tax=Salisaeta longa TaxID=503170 RepID=UPI0003F8F17F|nr:3-oxoacyl-ACP reductase [Salisaeta longa]